MEDNLSPRLSASTIQNQTIIIHSPICINPQKRKSDIFSGLETDVNKLDFTTPADRLHIKETTENSVVDRESIGILKLEHIRLLNKENSPLTSLSDLENSDFGKESLGIIKLEHLNIDNENKNLFLSKIFDINQSDVGKESLGILKLEDLSLQDEFEIKKSDLLLEQNKLSIKNVLTIEKGNEERESLGILKLEHLSIQNEFENIKILKNLPANKLLEDDVGRESLGILQLENLKILNESDNTPQILLSCLEKSFDKSPRLLDRGFLSSKSKLDFGSTKSTDSHISFNTNSLDLPSRICSALKSDSSSYILSPNKSFLNNAMISNSLQNENRQRFLSQPSNSHGQTESRKCWSASQTETVTFEKQLIQSEKLDFDVAEQDFFPDSVFIEGQLAAQKIADGSFVMDPPEIGLLDSTPQPEYPEFDEIPENDPKSPVASTESVFKSIDKMFPSTSDVRAEPEFKIKTSRSDSASSKSKDANKILQNLSEIFNCSRRSDKQKSEGRLLINNLVEILNSSQKVKDDDDSGHSSIIENVGQKNSPIHSDTKVNVKKETVIATGRSSASTVYNNRRKPSLPLLKGPGKEVPVATNKVKSKSTSSDTKKGPLKAIIPVEQMKRGSQRSNTPDKFKIFPATKTSTPINQSKMKPIAQSTPSIGNNESTKLKSIVRRSIPLKATSDRPKSESHHHGVPMKANGSFLAGKRRSSSDIPSLTAVQNQSNGIRRSSFNDGIVSGQRKVNRSASLGGEIAIMPPSFKKMRENLLKSGYCEKKTRILGENINVAEDKRDSAKSWNKSDKVRKINKENVLPTKKL